MLDVGVGYGHMIVLTADGDVWGIGSSVNGQLGMGAGVEKVKEWAKLDLKLEEGKEIVGVVAGPRCSFVLVKRD